MASAPAGARATKPSFAKVSQQASDKKRRRDGLVDADVSQIAATGLKPSNTQGVESNKLSNTKQHDITSASRDGPYTFTPSSGSVKTTRTKPAAQAVGSDSKERNTRVTAALLQVHVHNVDGTAHRTQGSTTAIGLLAPATQEDSNTQISSSSGSVKPPSLDGKSVASGTTFALDEKESLRPDDSASVKDDEDVFSPPSTGLPETHPESEEGVRAFRDQLREISSLEPSARGITPQGFRAPVNPQQGVLYVPPHGLGVGLVPSFVRGASLPSTALDLAPDPKLLEALDSPRDRVWVLKLEQDVFDFIKDAKEVSLNLPQCNAYHRMLAHKIADYYMLGHIVDDSASAVRLYKTPDCRIAPPLTGITAPSTAASTPPPTAPQMKILRRGDAGPAIANGSNIPSKSTSENGDSEDDKKSKLPASREEREARYEAARLRIMGSAKPSGSPDELKANEDSRSSSAAGKKHKKKQRSDSEDGFEARSAYFQQSNAYFTPSYGSNGFTSTPYEYPTFSDPAHGSAVAAGHLSNQNITRSFQAYSDQTASVPWAQPGCSAANGMQQWPHAQQPGFDIASNFQQAMSLHSPVLSTQAPHMAPGLDNSNYQQQFYGGQQVWPQQDYQMQAQLSQSNNASVTGYQQRPPSSSSQARDYPYQFGQLPSQTFPGRPPTKLEHPLPGSYKGKHFNPQSQAFVPGQQSNAPFAAEGANFNNAAFGGAMGMGVASPTQRQASAFGPPHHTSASAAANQNQHQPMMHPLPQPVFPQQLSPNLPLPPKPGSTPQKPIQQQFMPPNNVTSGQNPSSIHKWVAPASLPAKPPPPTEPFDPARFAQLQRQPSYNVAAAARVPSGGMPNFGSMPPMTGGMGGMGVNGPGVQRQ
ncbi:hypothetical protein LTR08_003428 [Meristemomyces frigidus]|nr:hypothetical protein LTR08_003428 [Meristemomyces frigidus]